jgi:hypothetical protein
MMLRRFSVVACLLAAVLVGCSDRERVNCPRTKNKALRAETTITVDTVMMGSARTVETKCL